jgi:hypothetical protein
VANQEKDLAKTVEELVNNKKDVVKAAEEVVNKWLLNCGLSC